MKFPDWFANDVQACFPGNATVALILSYNLFSKLESFLAVQLDIQLDQKTIYSLCKAGDTDALRRRIFRYDKIKFFYKQTQQFRLRAIEERIKELTTAPAA